MANYRRHGEGEHHKGNVAVPAMQLVLPMDSETCGKGNCSVRQGEMLPSQRLRLLP
jgi:hypothetical protein